MDSTTGGIVVARINTVVAIGDRPTVIRAGEAWSATDPVVAAHPDLFSTDPADARVSIPRRREVEQSTRAPGERSRARRDR